MIRYLNCFRKKADLSDEEFRRYWISAEFHKLVEAIIAV